MLVLTLVIMGVATFLIGLLPTYEQIGPWAPSLLVLLRLAQGFGVGGEWGGAVLMAVEHAPPGKRGFYGSWPQIGVPGRAAAGQRRVLATSRVLPEEQFLAWGWRVPFLLSIVLVVVGLLIRMRILETPAFARIKEARPKRGSRSSKCSASTRSRCCWRWARGSRRTAASTSTACSSSPTRRRT